MNQNETLIHQFYTGFKNKDAATMQGCYADSARFSDAIFTDLNASQVRAMWEMLLRNGKDLSLEYSRVKADDKSGSAEWVATYTFSKTGRQVTNSIQANFEFEGGKIVKHTDRFDFYTWAKQAFGITGTLLGRTTFFKNKIQATAKNNLDLYMKKTGAK